MDDFERYHFHAKLASTWSSRPAPISMMDAPSTLLLVGGKKRERSTYSRVASVLDPTDVELYLYLCKWKLQKATTTTSVVCPSYSLLYVFSYANLSTNPIWWLSERKRMSTKPTWNPVETSYEARQSIRSLGQFEEDTSSSRSSSRTVHCFLFFVWFLFYFSFCNRLKTMKLSRTTALAAFFATAQGFSVQSPR